MSILDLFLEPLIQIISLVINLYIWIVIIAALISWVRPDPYNPIVQVLYKLTEPLYNKIRNRIPTIISGIDITPIIVLLALKFLDIFLEKLYIYVRSML
ncbi:MAG: YggT family protein [Helicobacteraceae bacterium]|nr:YggT family protein [Helicobacteraceae bacterium]